MTFDLDFGRQRWPWYQRKDLTTKNILVLHHLKLKRYFRQTDKAINKQPDQKINGPVYRSGGIKNLKNKNKNVLKSGL